MHWSMTVPYSSNSANENGVCENVNMQENCLDMPEDDGYFIGHDVADSSIMQGQPIEGMQARVFQLQKCRSAEGQKDRHGKG